MRNLKELRSYYISIVYGHAYRDRSMNGVCHFCGLRFREYLEKTLYHPGYSVTDYTNRLCLADVVDSQKDAGRLIELD